MTPPPSQSRMKCKISVENVDFPDDEVECLRTILENTDSEPPGPMYQDTNKHLAELLMNSGNEEEANYHLSESLGTTLRNQACSRVEIQIKKSKGDTSMLQNLIKHLEFGGGCHHGVTGLNKRLSDLPSEWTVLQLTLQWDPLSRFPPRNRDVNRGLGTFFTRFSCGDISHEMNDLGEGGKPITIFLPTLDDNKDRLSLMAAMRSHLSKMTSSRKVQRSKIHEECSLGVEATVNDMQMWIGGWHCLFFGRLANEKLQTVIKNNVDSIISSYEIDLSSEVKQDTTSKSQRLKQTKQTIHLSEKTLRILYLLASSPAVTPKELLVVISTLLDDQRFTVYLSKKICEITSAHSAALHAAKRHPVVLLIDEEMDILPFEVMSPLQEQPFTRMPSIHFLHAYYLLHKNTVLRNGVDTDKCFYIINPSKDLPQLEKVFTSISSISCVQKWKGVVNKIPTPEEVLKGLQENDMFLYCGHGGGNQFIPRDSIERTDIKSVVFLFGCSSSSLECLGGRVEMSSLFYSYLIGGSPCVVGMLWQVLDSDVNAMTQELVKIWCSSEKSSVKEAGDLQALETEFGNMKINASKAGRQNTGNLSEAVSLARRKAVRFLNQAALVVRGLPVFSLSKS